MTVSAREPALGSRNDGGTVDTWALVPALNRAETQSPAAPQVDATTRLSTRERILFETSKLFARQGYRGTTTRDIADAVGIRQPSLFHHFANKAEILSELLEIGLLEPPRVAASLAALTSPAGPRLYRFLHWDLLVLYESPYYLGGVYTVDQINDDTFANWWDRLGIIHRSLESMVASGVASGEFIDIDPRLAQVMISGQEHGHMQFRELTPPHDSEDRAHTGASFILRALLRDPERLDEVRQAAATIEVEPADASDTDSQTPKTRNVSR